MQQPKVTHRPLAQQNQRRSVCSHQRLYIGLSPDRIREVYAATKIVHRPLNRVFLIAPSK